MSRKSSTTVLSVTMDEVPTPKLSPVSSPRISSQKDPEDFVCYVCRRRLASAEMLRKHEELSALHERNLKALQMTTVRKRGELRADVIRLRTWGGSPEARAELLLAERDLGLAQEEMETKANTRIRAECVRTIEPFVFSFEGCSWTGNKPSNEDRMVLGFEIRGGITGCFVADGHCGEQCADFVVQHLVANIELELVPKLARTDHEKTTTETEGTAIVPDNDYWTESKMREAIELAFRKTDSDFLVYARANQVPAGSTIVIALFYPEPGDSLGMCVAHLGDSRAVMEDAVRLSSDHKPDRRDEKERLESAGGLVIDVGGVWRVFTPGVVSVGGRALQWGLAVSRAFGDLALKDGADGPIVSAEAEISFFHNIRIGAKIVLACDGIFDVMSDEQVCAKAESSESIVREAYGKLSDDNLTVIVIDTQRSTTKHNLSTRSEPPEGKKQRVDSPQPPAGRIAYQRATGEFD